VLIALRGGRSQPYGRVYVKGGRADKDVITFHIRKNIVTTTSV
jgi:hypothetical protein